jgi:hypothetical protein
LWINSAPFCRHFNIEVDSTRKFINPDLAGDTLYLSLAKTISVATRKRRKK